MLGAGFNSHMHLCRASHSISVVLIEMEFYGRQEILESLDKRANGLSKGYRQNIAIIGDELMGKTYLIKYWLSKYCDNFTLPMYIEVKPQAAFSAFLEKFIGILLFSFLKNSQVSLRDDISFLIERSRKYIPLACAHIEALLIEKKKKNTRRAFVKLLELPELFYKETNKSCIIILDEFHLLQELKVKDMYTHWRKQIMLSRHTMYILLSSRKQLAHKILSGDLNLLFGNFEKIEFPPFGNKTAQAFIQDKFKLLDVPSEIANFIINFCFCHPFYLNVIGNAFIDYYTKNASIPLTIGSLISSLENVFIDNWGILNRRFSQVMNQIEGSFKDHSIIKILIALSAGINSLSHIAHQAGLPKKEVAFALNHLLSLDVITKNADIYYVSDRIFSFWLRCIYVNQLNTFSIDYDKQKQLFRKEMGNLFAAFCEAQNKALGIRIVELFSQFSNESIEVHKKRVRLNHFKEVKLLDIHGMRIKEGILARAANTLWVAGLKADKVEEEDIIEFARLCRRLKYNKPQKRIFITFDDIDDNARLIAKEEKIATWDMSFVNSLFDIFDKPRIVK